MEKLLIILCIILLVILIGFLLAMIIDSVMQYIDWKIYDIKLKKELKVVLKQLNII